MEVIEPLRYCKYYKGENKCPYSLESTESTFWELEQTWVNIVNPSEETREQMILEFTFEYPDGIPYITDTPIGLKATIFDQYCHFYGSGDGFENYIKTYFNLARSR